MKFKLNIPKPCHEDWQQMSPTQKGKFCASCRKEVIDFTKLSSTEIARKTKNATQLCGRFTQSQLKQEYISPSQNRLNRLGIALGLGSIVAIAQPGFAQKKNAKEVKVQTQKDYQLQGEVALTTQANDSISINGIVKDEDGTPLPGVNVVQQNTTNGTHTNFVGNFSINISEEDFNSEAYLIFSFVGMQQAVIRIQEKSMNIALKKDVCKNQDEMIRGKVEVKKSK
ncbi:carboxypeptidase-like regulatory domain-containing protein [Mesonia oceanica]|uniref:TonB-dependent receptor SusC n=1 Tax=Mesonia oceanica TaxID=2687242 RepID=A0AC61YA56_9FLAO|nr:carboxypeptidase-like regulatory domain-containing protein [Mesonia oceanica]VVV01394.1 TonB-dependent receptor SusC [Mesonia oceanica]